RAPRLVAQPPSAAEPFKSGVPRSAARRWRALHASRLGFTRPFSHRLTVEKLRLSACARPSCVSPTRRRQVRMMGATSSGGPPFSLQFVASMFPLRRRGATRAPHGEPRGVTLGRPEVPRARLCDQTMGSASWRAERRPWVRSAQLVCAAGVSRLVGLARMLTTGGPPLPQSQEQGRACRSCANDSCAENVYVPVFFAV